MKSIALIHTVKTVANSFEQKLKDYVGEPVKIHNLWDDFLANNPNEIGEFTIENRCRLYNDIKSAEMTGADMIVVTCSTLTPVVNMIRPFVRVPLIAIDDAMGRKAVTCGERILVLATAGSTEGPMREKLNAEAAKLGKSIQIDFQANAEAFQAMKAVQMERHDAILLDMAKNISGYDCVVLAQASMAHLDQKIEAICKIPVLSSPGLCMEQVKETLKTI
ncbi:MAG: aspartate/glutamate racemase family protein [Clostridium sp.]|jgi:aspartate/glutamate racemase|uniref:aspartate/glutamate racemase family protein n=1 Tax=Clostridium sp. AF27-2AA TaxID=2292206 RepID=UPI000E542189|nr:aspartate/glutamate racemase family protein [Clostridium sp. AF27-2AA]RHQ30455.1 Asp/Glu racemase [Clostridium sp. AF27-2AA]